MPGQIRHLRSDRIWAQEDALSQRRLAQCMPKCRGCSHLALDPWRVADTEVLINGDQPGIERDIMRWARGESIAEIEPLIVGAIAPRLDMTRHHHSRPTLSCDGAAQSAEHTTVLVILQHRLCEPMLADAYGEREHSLSRQDGLFNTFSPVLLQLPFEFTLDDTDVEFSLTLELESETILEVKEIRQLDLVDAQTSSNVKYAQVETSQ